MSEYHPDLTWARFLPRIRLYNWNVALLQRLAQKAPAAPDDVRIRDIEQDGARVRVYHPTSVAAPGAALFWIHGGGYVQGSPIQDEAFCIAVARELGITVVSLRYRLAPANPAPAAIEDAYAALQWTVAHAAEHGVDPARIAIGGASAGAGLAAGVVLLAQDRGDIRPVFQLLRYPMLDDRTVLRDLDDSLARGWTAQNNRYGWRAYLGQEPGSDGVSEYSAPARRADLRGLPPAWIGVGTLDLFHDEDVEYAGRLTAAGVPCELHIVPGAFHGFDALFGRSQIARQFQALQVEALRGALFERARR